MTQNSRVRENFLPYLGTNTALNALDNMHCLLHQTQIINDLMGSIKNTT